MQCKLLEDCSRVDKDCRPCISAEKRCSKKVSSLTSRPVFTTITTSTPTTTTNRQTTTVQKVEGLFKSLLNNLLDLDLKWFISMKNKFYNKEIVLVAISSLEIQPWWLSGKSSSFVIFKDNIQPRWLSSLMRPYWEVQL